MRSSLFSFLAVALVAISFVDAQECGYQNYDFSSLMDSTIAGSDELNTYFIRPCSIIPDQPACQNKDSNVTVCAVTTGGGLVTVLEDSEEQPVWSLIPNGAQYTLTQPVATCYSDTWNLVPIVANIQFVCALQPGEMVVNTKQTCVYTFTIPTPLACSSVLTSCTFNGVDYSLFAGSDLPAKGPDSNGYWLRICGDLTSQPGCTNGDRSSSACMVAPDIGAVNLGDWSSAQYPVWSFINNDPAQGAQYTIESISPTCTDSAGALVPYTSAVQFLCASMEGFLSVVSNQNCGFIWTLPVPMACPRPGNWNHSDIATE